MSKPARTTPEDTPGEARVPSTKPGEAERPPDAGTSDAGTTVVFVRHGLTATTGKQLPGRAPGLHLSDEGQKQAAGVAQHLASLQRNGKPLLTAVYASPLERTMETAAPIAEAFDLEIRPEADLLEVDMGSWTGWELATAREEPAWDRVQRHPANFRFPDGESFVEMQTRMLSVVERVREGHPGETVVAVSHADPIRALVSHAFGAHLDQFQRVVISPCSLTAIACGAGNPLVLAVNSTDLSNVVKA